MYKSNDFNVFRSVANYTRSLDPYRPVTAAIAVSVYSDRAVSLKITGFDFFHFTEYFFVFFSLQAKHLDIISFNRYNGWYQNPGKLNMITSRVVDEAMSWYNKHNKPVLMSEYGCDTIEGLHLVSSITNILI